MALGNYRLDSNAAAVADAFRRLPPRVQASIRRSLAGALLQVEGRVRRGAALKWRHGSAGLSGRLTSFVRPGLLGLDARIGFRRTKGFPYELSQEFGAKARGGGAMAIPIDRTAKDLSERGQGPRRYPGLLRLVKTSDKVFLFPLMKNGRRIRVRPAYVLVKSIRPRLRFRETVFGSRDLIDRSVLDGWRAAKGQS
jgi:hypothetical protein